MEDFDSFLIGHMPQFPLSNMQQHHGLDLTNTMNRMSKSDTLNLSNSNSHHTSRALDTILPRQTQSGATTTTTPNRQNNSAAATAIMPSATTSSTQTTSATTTTGMVPPQGDPFGDLLTDFWMDQEHHMASPTRSSSTAPAETTHTDRLLSFRTHPPASITLLDAYGRPVEINLSAQLHGMFFLAESPWDAAGNAPDIGALNQPKELTCYRRNLFQVSGTVSIPSIHSLIISSGGASNGQQDMDARDAMVEGKRRQIQALEASISGIESVEGNTVKIIMVPWKSTASMPSQSTQSTAVQTHEEFPAPTPSRSAEKEPSPIFLNYSPTFFNNAPGSYPDDDTEPFSYPLNWKRLQFRSATANNGRRKDLQQHFLVRISIIATLFPENGGGGAGEKVTLSEAYSGAIIVRGRSPRNFSSRNDIPLSGSVASTSRQTPSTSTHSTTASAPKKVRHHSSNSLTSFEPGPSLQQLQENTAFSLPQLPQQDYLANSLDTSMVMNTGAGSMAYAPNLWPADNNWMSLSNPTMIPAQATHPTPHLKHEESSSNNDYLSYYSTNSFEPSNSNTNVNPSPRLNLTGVIAADEYDVSPPPLPPAPLPHRSSSSNSSHIKSSPSMTMRPPPPQQQQQQRPGPVPGVSSISSPSMDLLYEYFPIGVDDWLPPVEVVYRPHAAHHTTAVLSKGNARSKRLFSEVPFE